MLWKFLQIDLTGSSGNYFGFPATPANLREHFDENDRFCENMFMQFQRLLHKIIIKIRKFIDISRDDTSVIRENQSGEEPEG